MTADQIGHIQQLARRFRIERETGFDASAANGCT